jgi:hypothetical protein
MTDGTLPSVSVWLPIKTKNPGNTRPTNSVVAAIIQRKERTSQHNVTCLLVRAAMHSAGLKPYQLVPCLVTLTRISSGRLDPHDGLPSACKFLCDGIAEALGIDDGKGPVRWEYAQERGKPRQYGVKVRIQKEEL